MIQIFATSGARRLRNKKDVRKVRKGQLLYIISYLLRGMKDAVVCAGMCAHSIPVGWKCRSSRSLKQVMVVALTTPAGSSFQRWIIRPEKKCLPTSVRHRGAVNVRPLFLVIEFVLVSKSEE